MQVAACVVVGIVVGACWVAVHDLGAGSSWAAPRQIGLQER
jgi:hypothetical protein